MAKKKKEKKSKESEKKKAKEPDKKAKKKKKTKEPDKKPAKSGKKAQPTYESTLITTLTAKKGESDALDTAIEDTKETHATLQDLLSGSEEEDGFFRREKDEIIQPQLKYDSNESKTMRDFLVEGVPLTERKVGRTEIKQRTRLAEPKPEPVEEPVEEPPKKIPFEVSSVIEEPSFTQKEPESIYPKLADFFTGLIGGNTLKYDQWEDSTTSILSILRKMRKITKKNTEELVLSISSSFARVQAGLEEFKIKRTEVQRISEVNLDELSFQFRKVLGLLELQVKEYQLKLIADEYIHNI